MLRAPGEGRKCGRHPGHHTASLCAGRGARHMLQLQRTPGHVQHPWQGAGRVQKQPTDLYNPLLLPLCRPRAAVWPPSSLCKQHFNYKGGSSRYLLQRCPLSGQQQLRVERHPPSRNTGGAVSRKQGPRLLFLSDVTPLHRYLLSPPQGRRRRRCLTALWRLQGPLQPQHLQGRRTTVQEPPASLKTQAAGTIARADTNTPRWPSVQLGQLFLVQVGLPIPAFSETDTKKQGGKIKENQVSISHGWPQRAKPGLFRGYLTHGRGSRATLRH